MPLLATRAREHVAKISGPLLDRIAIHVHVQPVDLEVWSSSSPRMTSVEMRNMVQRARQMQLPRFAGIDDIDCNARLPEVMFSKHYNMEPAAEALFLAAQKRLQVSARARGHITRVARTIADLDGSERLSKRRRAAKFVRAFLVKPRKSFHKIGA